jgi:hypothetical protein
MTESEYVAQLLLENKRLRAKVRELQAASIVCEPPAQSLRRELSSSGSVNPKEDIL